MNQQPKAKIFLADERGCDEKDWYRSYSTFNFGKYYNEHKQAFDRLYVLNDDTLEGGRRLNMNIKESAVMLLLPIVGAVSYKDSFKNEKTVHAGRLHVSYLPAGAAIEVSNPYTNELINFLQIRIKAEIPETDNKPEIYSFDLNENKNNLIPLTTAASTANTTAATQLPLIAMGKFAGREEAIYTLKNEQNNLFVFIIQGVFEVQGRLLHARDGLGLWDVSEDIELEALSNDAIVLMLELSRE